MWKRQPTCLQQRQRLGVMDCDFPATGSTRVQGISHVTLGSATTGQPGVGTPNGLGAFAKTGPRATLSGPKSDAHGTLSKWTASTKDPFPAGTISSYSWNWGDGRRRHRHETTASATHDYVATGSRTITLTIKDRYAHDGKRDVPGFRRVAPTIVAGGALGSRPSALSQPHAGMRRASITLMAPSVLRSWRCCPDHLENTVGDFSWIAASRRTDSRLTWVSLVGRAGLEPTTPCVSCKCATNCANGP